MNIFVTSNDPIESAKYLDDKRVIKMIVESCQMLSTAHFVLDNNSEFLKPTHRNHPCNIWIRESSSNYVWLLTHARALSKEYTRRYGRIHMYEREGLLNRLSELPKNILIAGRTPFANCSGIITEIQSDDSTIECYKQCLDFKWKNDTRKPTWK